MIILLFFNILALSLGLTAGLSAAVSPDTVVAMVNGRQLTAGEIDRILAGVPPDMRETLRAEPRQFVQQYALLSLLAERAEERKLEDKSPFREQLAWARAQVLLQAAILEKSKSLAGDAEVKQWLDSVREEAKTEFLNEAYFAGDSKAAAAVADETVIAKVNGLDLTAGEIAGVLKGATARVRENFAKDRRQFLSEYAMMLRLVELAEEWELPSKSPYREQLEWVRMNTLSQACLNDYSNSINIGTREEQEYYDAHKDRYTQAKVKVVYIPFGSGDAVGKTVDGKKVLSEDEARRLAEDVRQKIAAGADFVEIVRKYSQDETSKAKDGDFGALRRSDKIPDHIKDAVFSLEAGEVSAPLRQPNGFYLFRVEEIGTLSLDEVRQTLNREAKSAKFNEWFNSVRQSVQVTFENEEYFTASGQ